MYNFLKKTNNNNIKDYIVYKDINNILLNNKDNIHINKNIKITKHFLPITRE